MNCQADRLTTYSHNSRLTIACDQITGPSPRCRVRLSRMHQVTPQRIAPGQSAVACTNVNTAVEAATPNTLNCPSGVASNC